MAGIPFTAADLNSRAGLFVQSLWTSLDQLHQFHLWLSDATHTDSYLNNLGVAGTTGSLSTDVGIIRAGISDLGNTSNGLWAVSHGTFTPTGTNNYFANAKALTGLNYAA